MTRKSKLVLLLLAMILTAVLTTYISFAWFSLSQSTKPIIITTGSLRVSTHFYVGVDENHDGVLDNNQYDEVTEGGISFTNVIPGQIFTFRLVAVNEGTTDGTLEIIMNDIETTDINLLKGFTLYYINPTDDSVVNISLENYKNNKFNMFEGYNLSGYGDGLIFEFKLIANELISANLQTDVLMINNYIVNLVQVHD
jgi:hypothetical protein